MAKPPRGIARFDSAAAMAQALAASLYEREFESLSGSPRLDSAMPLINALPVRLREWAYSVSGATEAIGARRLPQLDLEAIDEWLVGLYPPRDYQAAFVGSSNGALIHLTAALGVPWLPQTFLCPVRALGTDPDDPQHALFAGRRVVDALLRLDSRIAVHQMHDPNQDRLMLKTLLGMDHFERAVVRLGTRYGIRCETLLGIRNASEMTP